MPSEVEKALEQYRRIVAAQDAATMAQLAKQWRTVEIALEGRIHALAEQLATMKEAGQTISRSRLYQLEHYQKLLSQSRTEFDRYSKWAGNIISERQMSYAELGIKSAEAAIRATYMDAGVVGGYFDLLPTEAVDAMIGYAGDGTPLNKLLRESYPDTIDSLTETLVRNTAMGINPRQTAREMADVMSGNLDRALTIARTEQLRSYRAAAQQQYIESGVVEGYIRTCALNDRTCPACLALDGTEYETDELMDVHPNDRCFMRPKIKDLAPLPLQTGADWFAAQDEDTQRDILGPGHYDAWKSGAVAFRDMAQTHVDPTWGPTVQVAPLKSLL